MREHDDGQESEADGLPRHEARHGEDTGTRSVSEVLARMRQTDGDAGYRDAAPRHDAPEHLREDAPENLPEDAARRPWEGVLEHDELAPERPQADTADGQPDDDADPGLQILDDDDPDDEQPATGSHSVTGDSPAAAGGRTEDTAWRKAMRGVGQTLITLGVVVLLFIVYEAFITDIFTAQKQEQLSEDLQKEWKDSPTVGQETNFADVPVGDAFAVMRVPAFGADYAQVVVQGTTNEALEKGPGHYSDTAGPGEVGNFSIAGHRVGKGSPFLNLDRLKPGDPIVFETQANWYVYRVIGNKDSGDYTDPAFGGIKGQFVTNPEDYAVIAPVPGDESATPTQRLLTLTTCHPKFSAAERMIIHAYLDGEPLSKTQYPTAADVPALKEG